MVRENIISEREKRLREEEIQLINKYKRIVISYFIEKKERTIKFDVNSDGD